MSVESLAIALHHSRARGTARLVLIGIANHDGDGGAWPSVDTLARYAGGVDPRNVQKAIARLVSLGEVRVHVQAGGHQDTPDHRRPNRYDLLLSCPGWCDRTAQHRDTRSRQDPLWKNRVAKTPPVPGPGTAPGGNATPPPGGNATQTTQPNPPTVPAVVPQPQEGAAPPVDDRPCTTCGQGQSRCVRSQAAYPVADRHGYTPTTRRTR